MASKTAVFGPIISALVKAEDFLGPQRTWTPEGREQTSFLGNYFYPYREQLNKFSAEELRNWASRIAAELNAILAKEGFNIQLKDFEDDEFGVVSILDVMVKWLARGKKASPIFRGGIEYPAARLERFVGDKVIFETLSSSDLPEPFFRINTKSGDLVYMTVADSELESFALLRKIAFKSNSSSRRQYCQYRQYDFLEFPMVNLDQQVDISWLLGMMTSDTAGGQWCVSQALQQTKLKLNHEGARVKSAVAIGMMRSASLPPPPVGYIIDKPFFFWIKRPRLDLPIVAAYLDTDSWKDPGDLSTI